MVWKVTDPQDRGSFEVSHYNRSGSRITDSHYCFIYFFHHWRKKMGQILLMAFVKHHQSLSTQQFAWWSFQYWLLIITVLHPKLWLCDSTTKAARRKCQRILGKHCKAFELMRPETDAETPRPILLAFIKYLCTCAQPSVVSLVLFK